MGHVTAFLEETGNLTLKDVWLLVLSNRATMNKNMNQLKPMLTPTPDLFLGPAIFFCCLPQSMQCLHSVPFLFKVSKKYPLTLHQVCSLHSEPHGKV
jgi:hypothetical protein